MLEAGGRPCLILEPLQPARIEEPGKRERFERNLAAERNLLRLVDDPHSTAADLPRDAEVPQRMVHECVAPLHGRRRITDVREQFDPVDRLLQGRTGGMDGQGRELLNGGEEGVLRFGECLQRCLARRARRDMPVQLPMPLGVEPAGDQIFQLGS